jgi:hypothetical protein
MLDSLNQAFDSQKAKSMMFMSQSIDSTIKVEELKQLCDAAQTSINAYHSHVSSLNAEIAALRQEISSHKEEAKQYMHRVEREKEGLRAKYDHDLNCELSKAKAEHDKLKWEFDNMKRTNENLRASLAANNSPTGISAEARLVIDGLTNQLNEACRRCDLAVERHMNERKDLNDEMRAIKERLEIAERKLEDAISDRKKEETRLMNIIQAQKDTFKRDTNDLTRKLAATEEVLRVSEVERRQLKQRLGESLSEPENYEEDENESLRSAAGLSREDFDRAMRGTSPRYERQGDKPKGESAAQPTITPKDISNEVVDQLSKTLKPLSKESDKVACPPFPTVVALRNWLDDLYVNLTNASRHHDNEEIKWLKKVTEEGATLEQFADSGLERFHSLDRKLGHSVLKCIEAAPHDRVAGLKNNVRALNREALARNTLLTGRQLVFLIVKNLSINNSLKVGYDLSTLTSMSWRGDDKIPEFVAKWDDVVNNMSQPLEEHHLYSMMLDKIRQGGSKELDNDLRHIEMFHEKDPSCATYKFLRDALDRAMERQRTKRNTQEQREAALRNLRRLNGGKAVPGEIEDKPDKKDKKTKPDKKDKKDKKGKKGDKGSRQSTRSPSASGRTLPKERYVSGTPDPKICCWYFNHGDICKRGKDECMYLHMSPGKDKLNEIPNPKGKGKGSDKDRAAAPGENGSRESSRGRERSRNRGNSKGRNSSKGSRKSSSRGSSRASSNGSKGSWKQQRRRSRGGHSPRRRSSSQGSDSKSGRQGKGKGKKKLNVCKFYADGQCTKGENCGFLHMSEEAAAEYARECKRTKGSSRGSNSDK